MMVFLQRQMRSVRKAGTGSEQEGRRRPQEASPSRTAMQWKWRLRSLETDLSQYFSTWRPSCSALTSSRSAGKGGEMAAGEEWVSICAQWSPLRTIFLEQRAREMSGARERVSWKALWVWEELMRRCGCAKTAAADSITPRRISLLNIQIIQYTLAHFQKHFLAAHPPNPQNTHHPAWGVSKLPTNFLATPHYQTAITIHPTPHPLPTTLTPSLTSPSSTIIMGMELKISLIILMGICYSQQQQWEAYKQSRTRERRRRKPRTNQVIEQEKSIYASSFASNVYASFREDLHNTISEIAQENGSVFMGSIVQMKEEELDILYKSLHKINPTGEPHLLSDPLILCNIKTKNYLHTHKIKIPESRTLNEISCCPYNSNHIAEYDIWKLVKADQELPPSPSPTDSDQDEEVAVYIYHPFTQRFFNVEKGNVVGSQQRRVWRVHSMGPRRNGGFVRISCEEGELCMSEQKGLLEKHRKLQICKEKHISHLWEVMLIEPELM